MLKVKEFFLVINTVVKIKQFLVVINTVVVNTVVKISSFWFLFFFNG